MILDRLENRALYRSFGRRLFEALEYLAVTDIRALQLGKQEIEGDRLFAVVQRYRPKTPAEARWEAHRKYIDVQYVASGAERIGYAPLREDTPLEEAYDAARDAVFYQAQGILLPVPAGSFAVFTPHDIHAPCLLPDSCPGSGEEVLKVVMKCLWQD
jgi:YhcH/YjgK/YiaL family protein